MGLTETRIIELIKNIKQHTNLYVLLATKTH